MTPAEYEQWYRKRLEDAQEKLFNRGTSDEYQEEDWLTGIGEKQKTTTKQPLKICECGAEAIKAAYHSTWCAKYE